MLVLLPPSERKAPARSGAPLDLALLRHAELADARQRVLEALAAVSDSPQAHTVLGTTASLREDVARNTAWRDEPAQRVDRLFTGVLYEALSLATLPRVAALRARERVVVVSAAFGLLHIDDRVPAHRLAMDVDLPGVGALAAHWRPHLSTILDPLVAQPGQVVLDARSSAYAAAWRPPRDLAGRVVAVRVVSERDGVRTVVSHAAKHTRGLLARHLLTRRRREPRDAEQLVAAAAEVFEVEFSPAPPGRPATLDVVLRPPAVDSAEAVG